MIPNNEFMFPKSLYTVYDCLYAVLKNRKHAVVLDFFAGSGTTGHTVLLLNKNLGSNHRFILCTNNDVGEKREKEFANESEGCIEWSDWQEKYGIASSVTYPRLKSAIMGYIHNKDFKNLLYQKRITVSVLKNPTKVFEEIDKIKQKNKEYAETKIEIIGDTVSLLGITKRGSKIEGISSNLKYYKTDFVAKDSEEIYDDLLEHIEEMIQLQYGVKIDKQKYVIIMDDDEMDEFERNFARYDNLKALFINQDVLLSSSQEKLLDNVNTYMIPDCYFDFELREAGELW